MSSKQSILERWKKKRSRPTGHHALGARPIRWEFRTGYFKRVVYALKAGCLHPWYGDSGVEGMRGAIILVSLENEYGEGMTGGYAQK